MKPSQMQRIYKALEHTFLAYGNEAQTIKKDEVYEKNFKLFITHIRGLTL